MTTTTHLEDLSDRIRPAAASNLLLWSIAGFFVILLLWATFTKLDRSVHGQGRVVPTAQLQTVSNLEGGIVEEILVRAGQKVREGAPLIRLDRTASGAELGSNQSAYDSLLAKTARLEAETSGRAPVFPVAADPAVQAQIDIERALYASRQADYQSISNAGEARLAQAERAVAEADATVAARTSARNAARSEAALIRPLVERGIEPRLSLIQAENAAAVAAGEAAAATASAARARSAVVEARATLAQTRQDWRAKAGEELAAARGEIASRRRALPALSDRLKRTVVRAPLAGRINRVLVTTVGGSVAPGSPLVEIVPTDGSLTIEAAVRPEDIAFVRTGQRARINITAYDYAIYGSVEGSVVDISPDAVVNERTGDSHYVVRVRSGPNGLRDGNGGKLPIGPGMVADVTLLGDKRSVLSYLLTPISRLRETAFQER